MADQKTCPSCMRFLEVIRNLGESSLNKDKRIDELLDAEPVCGWVGCWEVRYGGWRFCKDHLKKAREELQESGYLQSIPWQGGPKRTAAMMELTRETKYGKDQG